jgi:SAM-dependent MidA family methyltransferase
MEAALYDPIHGFYARHPVGEDGDFVTAPHVSPSFGVLLARLLEHLWSRLGRPRPFAIVEAGAGDGTLARRMLASLPPEMASVTDYVAVERSPGARQALERIDAREAGVRMVKIHDDLPRSPLGQGVVLANELLDNLPFRRVRGTTDGAVELRVGTSVTPDGGFVLVESPLPPDLAPLLPPLREGQETVVSQEGPAFVERAARTLGRGYIVLIDYALERASSTPWAPVHGYRRQRVEADVLVDPGSRDITAGIDVEALVTHARDVGLNVWPPITQHDALTNLGIGRWDRALRDRQAEALDAGRGAEAARIYSARNAARLLTDPAGMGAFTVLCFGVGDAPRPRLLLDGE